MGVKKKPPETQKGVNINHPRSGWFNFAQIVSITF